MRKEFIPGNNSVYDSNGSLGGTSSCIADITGPSGKFCEGFNQKSDGPELLKENVYSTVQLRTEGRYDCWSASWKNFT